MGPLLGGSGPVLLGLPSGLIRCSHTHLLGTVDSLLTLWAVLSIYTMATLRAPVAPPQAAHTSATPGGAGMFSGWVPYEISTLTHQEPDPGTHGEATSKAWTALQS